LQAASNGIIPREQENAVILREATKSRNPARSDEKAVILREAKRSRRIHPHRGVASGGVFCADF